MTTSYKTVFERFLGSIDDPMLLRLDYNSLLEFIRDWLHAAASNPRFRHKFKTFSMDDELMTITYELNFPVDDEADERFVVGVLSLGMVIRWMEPKVKSAKQLSIAVGEGKEKVLVNNYKQSVQELAAMKSELKQLISDYGYLHNSYISRGET